MDKRSLNRFSYKKTAVFIGVLLFGILLTVPSFIRYGFLPKEIISGYYKDQDFPEKSISVLRPASVTAVNSRMEGRKVIPEAEDARIIVTLPREQDFLLRSVEISFAEGFPGTTDCCLYYPDQDGIYSEAKKLAARIAAGRTEVFFSIPETDTYPMRELRIDIDAAYELRDIRISEEKVEGLAVLPEKPDRKAALLLLLSTALIVFLAMISGDAVCRSGICPPRKWKQHLPEAGFLAAIFILAAAYMLSFLPFSSPDELAHFLSAYRISDLFCGQLTAPGDPRLVMRAEDFFFTAARQKELFAGLRPQINTHFHLFARSSGYRVIEAPLSSNALFCYIPSALAIAAARCLHLGAEFVFYAGRLANVLVFTVSAGIALKKQGPYRDGLFALMMLPMMLHLAGSCSYDGIIFSLSLLFCTQIMVMASGDGLCSRRERILLAVFGILLAPAKTVYAVLLFLVFLIPSGRMGKTKAGAFAARLGILLPGLLSVPAVVWLTGWLTKGTAVHQMLSESTGGHIVAWAGAEGYTISWILQHPAGYIRLLLRTLRDSGSGLFFTMLGSRLGRMDIPVPELLCLLSFLLLLAGIFMENEEEAAGARFYSPGRWQKLLIILLAMISAVGIATAILISWTPLTANVVMGLQGRYFLPLVPPLIWALRTPKIIVSGKLRRSFFLLCVLVNLCALFCVCRAQFF